MNSFNKLIEFFFLKKNKKDMKNLIFFLKNIKFFEKKINFYSNDELRNQTLIFKSKIKEKTKFFYKEIDNLQKKLSYKKDQYLSIEEINEKGFFLKKIYKIKKKNL